MKGVGLEGLADFVDEREHDRVDLGMQGAIAFAVESVRVGPGVFFGHLYPRRFVKLRVDPEQVTESTGPGLVSQQIDLRDDADAVFLAGLDDGFYLCPGERVGVAQFGVAVELEIVIDPENEGVHAAWRQVLPDELRETLDLRRRGRGNAQSPHRKALVEGVFRAQVESLRESKEQGDQEALHDGAIIGSIPRPGQAGSADGGRDRRPFHAARRSSG